LGRELFVPMSPQLPDAFIRKVIFIRSLSWSLTVILKVMSPVDIPNAPSPGRGSDKTGGEASASGIVNNNANANDTKIT